MFINNSYRDGLLQGKAEGISEGKNERNIEIAKKGTSRLSSDTKLDKIIESKKEEPKPVEKPKKKEVTATSKPKKKNTNISNKKKKTTPKKSTRKSNNSKRKKGYVSPNKRKKSKKK